MQFVTAPGFLDQWWEWFVDWLLANDDVRPLRISLVATAGVLLWRAVWLASQSRSTPAPRIASTPVEAPNIQEPALRRWFPSRQDRLQRAVDQVRAETDLLLSKTAETQASAGLAKARAELAALMRELEPSASTPATQSTPTLTLNEIIQCIDLLDLEVETRKQLVSLITARTDENAS
ncbi:MAG: hypothetical protein ABL907_22795 [Hyphomicrobium sp.]